MTEIIQYPHELIQETTENGDDCHHNIKGLTNGQTKRFFGQYHKKFAEFKICNNDNNHHLSGEEIKEYIEELAKQDEGTI